MALHNTTYVTISRDYQYEPPGFGIATILSSLGPAWLNFDLE